MQNNCGQHFRRNIFVGRDGGDEFIAVLKQVDHKQVKDCLQMIREQTERYSKNHPDMPLSYAVGYALSTDFPGNNMKDLFRYADKKYVCGQESGER